jgi:hypothetical protein
LFRVVPEMEVYSMFVDCWSSFWYEAFRSIWFTVYLYFCTYCPYECAVRGKRSGRIPTFHWSVHTEPKYVRAQESIPRNRFINSASLCSLTDRYDKEGYRSGPPGYISWRIDSWVLKCLQIGNWGYVHCNETLDLLESFPGPLNV